MKFSAAAVAARVSPLWRPSTRPGAPALTGQPGPPPVARAKGSGTRALLERGGDAVWALLLGAGWAALAECARELVAK